MTARAIATVTAALCVSCGGQVTLRPTCEPWLTGAAAGVVEPVEADPPGTVLLARFGPSEAAQTVRWIHFDAGPCESPGSLPGGAWATDAALPSGDPNALLAPREVIADADGHAAIDLGTEVVIPAGSFGWVARSLDNGCNAVASTGPADAESLLWRPDGSGWQAIDGVALLSPADCQ